LLNKTGLAGYCVCLGLTGTCEAAPVNILPTDSDSRVLEKSMEKGVTNARGPINRRFRTLDDYLAHLERRSHMDGKWYKQIRPGVYELQTGNLRLDTPGGEKRIFTRGELAKKFGFAN